MSSAEKTLEHLRTRSADLVVRSAADGVFIAPGWQDMTGRYFGKGEPLGYVTDKVRPLARVVVSQDEIDRVRLATDRVQIRMAQNFGEVLDGRIVRMVPAGEAALPSRALSIAGGGQIAVDPQDPHGDKALSRMFQLDVMLEGDTHVAFFGQHVRVRFDFRPEPLASQWYRAVRRLFLTHFNV